MPDKVKAIIEMTTPTSVTELQCFLGICNFLSKFSPRMAEISEPLRQLTCKGVPFIWGPEHTEAFNMLKREISTAPVLKYYDPHKPLTLQTDACSKGLVLSSYKMDTLSILHQKHLQCTTKLCHNRARSTCCIMDSTKVPSLPIWKSLHFAD